MPFGGNDWHALTTEQPLEPDLPICDPHHHFWDRRMARIPYQRYQLDELTGDTGSGHNVRSTVFIECRSMYRTSGPEEMRPVGEVEYVQGQAAASASGVYGPTQAAAAIIGHANLNLGDRVEPVLQALQAASPNHFRGIRHSVTWDPHPEVENTAAHKKEGQLGTDQFRAGARVLTRMGFTLEGWCYHPQLAEMAAFAKAVPELTVVLNHVGGLLRTGPYANRNDEIMQNWRKGIAAVAACPNVVIKLGGLGMVRCGFDWHLREKPIGSEELAADMAPFLNYCIEQFTPARCMFESNFPVDRGMCNYHVLWNAFKKMTQHYPAEKREYLFSRCAIETYRLAI